MTSRALFKLSKKEATRLLHVLRVAESRELQRTGASLLLVRLERWLEIPPESFRSFVRYLCAEVPEYGDPETISGFRMGAFLVVPEGFLEGEEECDGK